jgi:hypothetical protein
MTTCATCPYQELSRCRRYPPTAGVGYSRLLPVVHLEDWCGEHPELAAAREARIAEAKPAPDILAARAPVPKGAGCARRPPAAKSKP